MKQILITCILWGTFSSCFFDRKEELSDHYYFEDQGNDNKVIIHHRDLEKGIYGEVLRYDYNKDFILALQKPSYNEHRKELAGLVYETLENGIKQPHHDLNYRDSVADSILENDSLYIKIFSNPFNYWIIYHKEEKIIGPLQYDEYISERKRLNVPESLSLKKPE